MNSRLRKSTQQARGRLPPRSRYRENSGQSIRRAGQHLQERDRPSWIQSWTAPSQRTSLTTSRLRGQLRSYVDVRDVADLVEAALTAVVAVHETFTRRPRQRAVCRLRTLNDMVAMQDDCTVDGDAAAYSTAKVSNHWVRSPSSFVA